MVARGIKTYSLEKNLGRSSEQYQEEEAEVEGWGSPG